MTQQKISKMKKQNDYQKFYAVKMAQKDGQEMRYNDKPVAYLWPESVHLFAGVTRIEIRLIGSNETIFADIQDIDIFVKV